MQNSISCMAVYILINQLLKKLADLDPHSLQRNLYWFRNMKMMNSYCQSIYNGVCLPECLLNLFNFHICDVTDKIVITSFSVSKQVDQGL